MSTVRVPVLVQKLRICVLIEEVVAVKDLDARACYPVCWMEITCGFQDVCRGT